MRIGEGIVLKENNDYIGLLNVSIIDFFENALRVIYRKPAMTRFLLKTALWQKKAADRRSQCLSRDLQVPPYMIISVTNRCNLNCKGCYSKAQHRTDEKEMDRGRLRGVISEAAGLGISFIFLAGGEPLIRPDILDITKDFPEIIFPLFTNGLLITDELIESFKKQKNVVPVISIEGYETDTDGRRGSGVYGRLQGTMEKLEKAGVFYGLSFTVTNKNFETLTDKVFISEQIRSGCQLFFFVEYVPIGEGTEDAVITEQQRAALAATLDDFRQSFDGLFVSFLGDEEAFGGCLSAGRGFIHISAAGDLEPCPFAPYSDSNVRETALEEALRSELLRKIRANHSELNETTGGCALWEKRDWVKSML